MEYMCVGGKLRWVGRPRGKEAVEVTYVKENEMTNLGIRGQGSIKSAPSSPFSLAILDPSLVTCPSVSQPLGTQLLDWQIQSKGRGENDKVRRGEDKAIDTLWQVKKEVEKKEMTKSNPKHLPIFFTQQGGWVSYFQGVCILV